MKHANKRAEERYYIENFDEQKAIKEILNDRCITLISDIEKYSHTFLIRYCNKYIKVVTDFNINFVKTILPINTGDFEILNELLNKLSACPLAA